MIHIEVKVNLMPSSNHEIFMRRCIQLAKNGLGYVAPNPMVGALLICDGKIISEGYHQRFGESHAEVNAIKNVSDEQLEESTLYVNLEPCSHFGKTPPCADLIIEKKIKTVVIGCKDPYKEVAGKGIAKLEAAGVEVILDVCSDECIELNKRFFTAIENKRPYIILKYAQSSDGYIGLDHSAPTQISNEYSQRLTHRWRSEESSILVGTNTAVLDNPQLNARLHGGNNPVRIAFDRELKIPASHHLFDGSQKTMVFTSKEMKALNSNVQFVQTDFTSVSFLENVLKTLLKNNIQSILVEGGAHTLQNFYDAGLWDEARIFTATKLLGNGTKSPIISQHAVMFEKTRIGSDTLTTYKNTNPLCF